MEEKQGGLKIIIPHQYRPFYEKSFQGKISCEIKDKVPTRKHTLHSHTEIAPKIDNNCFYSYELHIELTALIHWAIYNVDTTFL